MDDQEITAALVQEWREAVSLMRKRLFGSPSLERGRFVSNDTVMTRKEITGYLNDVFENWRGLAKTESNSESRAPSEEAV